jgi:hypothetical protein
MGICANVPDGQPDPMATCMDTGAAGCGNNGKCQAGACQSYPQGTPCRAASCPANTATFTPAGTCNGAGTCTIPAATSCFPYSCGTAACNSTCRADADCAPPGVCSGGSCGLKPPGATCGTKDECQLGFCEQGICCQTACTGICKSCALSNSRGLCSNIADGNPDVAARCSDQGAASCGTDGFCDGKGACRLYGAGTICLGASCPKGQSTQTNARTCDGLGVCQTPTTKACAPYVCDGTSMSMCLGTCTSDQDCLSPIICDPQTSRCG